MMLADTPTIDGVGDLDGTDGEVETGDAPSELALPA